MATRDLSGERQDEFMKWKVNNNPRIQLSTFGPLEDACQRSVEAQEKFQRY